MNITHNLQHWLDNLANKTHKWIPADAEYSFQVKLAKDPKDPSMQYYLENPIEYKMNNMGFRTPIDFVDGVEGNLFLGCSHTMGIGHHLSNVWAWKLNEYVGGNFLNAGVGGAGIGTAFRLLYGLKDMIKPKNVFLFTPHANRFEYFREHTIDNKGWVALQTTTLDPKSELFSILSANNNVEVYYYTNFIAIKDLCRTIGANLYTIADINFISPSNYPWSNMPQTARDSHLPVSNHHYIFERFKKSYDNNETPSSKPLEFNHYAI